MFLAESSVALHFVLDMAGLYLAAELKDIKHLFPSEYGWALRCSEQHKENIFNTVIQNGKKYFINRAAIGNTAAGN